MDNRYEKVKWLSVKMGFHNRARDYLFQEFIERNYQNVNEVTKRELLKVSPDNILKYKSNIHQYKNFNKTIIYVMDFMPVRKRRLFPTFT